MAERPDPHRRRRPTPRTAAPCARTRRAAAGRRPPQAPAGALVPAADGDAAPRRRASLSLLALDFAGLFAAIFTALMVKAVLRDGDVGVARRRCVEARQHDRLRLPGDRAAVRALRASTPSARSGPGLPRIVSSLFQVTVVALIFALVNGEQYSSYYIFYGTLFFAIVYVGSLRWGYERVTGVAAARRRLPPPRGARRLRASTSRTSRTRSTTRCTRRSRWSASSRSRRGPTTGCARSGGSRTSPRCSTRHRVQEVIIADPDFPQERAVELVDQCHQRGVTVRDRAVDDGDPRPPRGVRARARRCRCSSCARRCSTASTTCVKRTFDFVVALLLLRRCSARCCC